MVASQWTWPLRITGNFKFNMILRQQRDEAQGLMLRDGFELGAWVECRLSIQIRHIYTTHIQAMRRNRRNVMWTLSVKLFDSTFSSHYSAHHCQKRNMQQQSRRLNEYVTSQPHDLSEQMKMPKNAIAFSKSQSALSPIMLLWTINWYGSLAWNSVNTPPPRVWEGPLSD